MMIKFYRFIPFYILLIAMCGSVDVCGSEDGDLSSSEKHEEEHPKVTKEKSTKHIEQEEEDFHPVFHRSEFKNDQGVISYLWSGVRHRNSCNNRYCNKLPIIGRRAFSVFSNNVHATIPQTLSLKKPSRDLVNGMRCFLYCNRFGYLMTKTADGGWLDNVNLFMNNFGADGYIQAEDIESEISEDENTSQAETASINSDHTSSTEHEPKAKKSSKETHPEETAKHLNERHKDVQFKTAETTKKGKTEQSFVISKISKKEDERAITYLAAFLSMIKTGFRGWSFLSTFHSGPENTILHQYLKHFPEEKTLEVTGNRGRDVDVRAGLRKYHCQDLNPCLYFFMDKLRAEVGCPAQKCDKGLKGAAEKIKAAFGLSKQKKLIDENHPKKED